MSAHPYLPRAARAACLLSAVVVFASAACKPGPTPVVIKRPDGTVIDAPPPVAPEDEERAAELARNAGALEAKGDTEAAAKERDTLVERYPGTAAGAAELYRRAETARAEGRTSEAIQLYESLLLHRPTFEQTDAARIAYGEMLLAGGRYADAVHVLQPLFDDLQVPAEKARVGAMLARALHKTEDTRAALDLNMALRSTPGLDEAARRAASDAAYEIVAKRLSFSDAEALWKEVKDEKSWSFLHPVIAFRLAKIYFHTRDYDSSRAMLEHVVSGYPDHPLSERARGFLERLRARFEVDPVALGVLLPLSGRFRQYGERSLAAIRMVFAHSNIRLVVRDSEEEPTAASRAVEDLVLQDHVIAIIGPDFSKPAMAAALKAEELSVPILCLSHREGIPEVGEWVFRTALTIDAQARALARLAFEEMGWSRFAILHPRNSYGTAFAQAFWDEVDRRKGEIRGIESYETDQTTFQNEVRLLVGRYYVYARAEYHHKISELRAKNLPSHRFQAALEEYRKLLPPVVDFDAIIIPDSGRTVGLVAPALAFEDIVLTRDPKMLATIRKTTGNEHLNPVTLMGGSTWNSPAIVESCDRYCEEALFVDGFYADSPDPKVREFVSLFREATGTDPLLTDAQAYDTAGLVRRLLETGKPRDRGTLRKLLLEPTFYEGVTGKMRFDEQGEIVKDLFELTIVDRQIRPWVKPEEPPEG